MPDRHTARRARLAGRLVDRDLPGALICHPANVRYLTGFTGSNGALLLQADGTALLGTDGRYRTQAGAQAPELPLLVDRPTAPALAARGGALGRLAFEEHAVTVELARQLAAAAPQVAWLPLDGEVERLRVHKDPAELSAIAAACRIADQALAGLLGELRPGRTERDVAWRLESRMRELGAERPAFETIVAAGPHSAIPHHEPTDRPLARGDLLKMDFGAVVDGYHSDLTRTLVLGPAADWQRELHALVAAAAAAGRDAARPGQSLRAVDAAARDLIRAAGHAADFPHGLGHGVGLEIHEAPFFNERSAGTLDDATPATVEPGVYLPGRGGVRIEDTLVARAGGAEVLTASTRELLVL